MRKLLATCGALAALCLLTAASASASLQFGKQCTGNATKASSTVLLIANGEESSLSASAGPWELWGSRTAVITRWRVQVGPGLGPLPQQLVTFNYPGESELLVRNLGESAVETLAEGSNEFATRIPIPDYAHIGLRGPAGTLYCEGTSSGLIGVVESDFPAGSTGSLKMEFPDGVPAIATLEPDADGDGYGDETQDGCPRVAALQTPCPPAVLSGRKATVRKRAVLVDVQVNGPAQVAVAGRTGWKKTVPRGKSPGTRVTTVMTTAGAPVQMAPNAPQTFRLPLPRSVQRKLAALPPRKALQMRVTTSVTDLAGVTSESAATVKLPGRKQRP